jgi:predicted membrane protein
MDHWTLPYTLTIITSLFSRTAWRPNLFFALPFLLFIYLFIFLYFIIKYSLNKIIKIIWFWHNFINSYFMKNYILTIKNYCIGYESISAHWFNSSQVCNDQKLVEWKNQHEAITSSLWNKLARWRILPSRTVLSNRTPWNKKYD